MYLNESIQTKTLILLLCFLQTPCKYNVSFTKDSKLTGILDIIIITLVVFVLFLFFINHLWRQAILHFIYKNNYSFYLHRCSRDS